MQINNKKAELSKLVTNSTGLPKSQCEKKALSEHWIAALFKKFQARYGHKWTSNIQGIEKLAVQEWAEGLAEVSGEQIKNALDKLESEWPPTLPEFKALCNDKPEPTYREKNPERLLESDEMKAERVERNTKGVNELKNILGMTK